MTSIRRLPDDVVRGMRSGVVIAGVPQAIEELVVNAVEAGGTNIVVKVTEGGLGFEVADNGDGIREADMKLLGRRYYTSKAGGKGEALASICETADEVTVTSKLQAAYLASVRVISPTEDTGITYAPRGANGTTVKVSGMFGKYPVRRTAIIRSKPGKIQHQITSIIRGLCMANPKTSLRLIYDDNLILAKGQTDNLLSTFGAVCGSSQTMVEIPSTPIVAGIISKGCTANSKELQFIVINNRAVKCSLLDDVVNTIYSRSRVGFTKDHAQHGAKHPSYTIVLKLEDSSYDLAPNGRWQEMVLRTPQPVVTAVMSSVCTGLQQAGFKTPNSLGLVQGAWVSLPPPIVASQKVEQQVPKEQEEDDDDDEEAEEPQPLSPTNDELKTLLNLNQTCRAGPPPSSNRNPPQPFKLFEKPAPKALLNINQNCRAGSSCSIPLPKTACLPKMEAAPFPPQPSPFPKSPPKTAAHESAPKKEVPPPSANVAKRPLTEPTTVPPVPKKPKTTEVIPPKTAAHEGPKLTAENLKKVCDEVPPALQPTNREEEHRLQEIDTFVMHEEAPSEQPQPLHGCLDVLGKKEENIRSTVPLMYRRWYDNKTVVQPGDRGQVLLQQVLKREDVKDFVLVGQSHLQFIVGVVGGVICAVDQHAADERCKLEALKKYLPEMRGGKELLEPATLKCTSEEFWAVKEHEETLRSWGWRVSYLTGTTTSIAVTSVAMITFPSWVAEPLEIVLKPEALLQAAIEVSSGGPQVTPSVYSRHLASKACRSALMFNTYLSPGDCRALLSALAKTNDPFHCAHGRPSIAPLCAVPSHGEMPVRKPNLKSLKVPPKKPKFGSLLGR